MNQRISAGLGLALITIFSSAVGILILTNGKTFAIHESTKETSKSQHLDATQLVGKKTMFDSCGKIDKYLGEPWYRNVTQSLSDNGQSASGILDVCQSIDKTFVIILTNGGSSDGLIPYCDAGALYQYDVLSRVF